LKFRLPIHEFSIADCRLPIEKIVNNQCFFDWDSLQHLLLSIAYQRSEESSIGNRQSTIVNSWNSHTVNCKVGTVEPAEVASRASLLVGQVGGVIAVAVEFPGKCQGFGRAKFEAKAAALAAVPIDENLATKLASFCRRRCFRHVNLDKKRNFPTLRGTGCPILGPVGDIEHF
jgi:hypothetical protein